MTPQQDRNESIEARKAARAERRRKAEQERKKLKLRLAAAAVVVVAAVGMIALFSRGASGPAPEQTAGTTAPAQTEAESTQPEETGKNGSVLEEPEDYTVIHIAAAGDLNVTDHVVANAMTPNGPDYASVFRDVAPVMSQADLTLLNLEGNFSGAPYGSATGSAPAELAHALKNLGVDAVQTANSASIRAGILGLQSTIDTLYGAGLLPVGTFHDSAEFRSSGGYTIVEVQDLRIALVGFTKGMDNLGLPAGSEDCVNVLYEDYATDYKKVDKDGIRKVLRRVEEDQPDLTIAMVHWGSEYNEDISRTQKIIRNLMLENGVDIILGTHPHLVQTVDLNREENTLVAYSLGDFYGDADQPGTNYSLVLDIEVTRDNLTGDVTITDYTYTPIYTICPEDSAAGGQRVVRTREAMRRYETNYLGKITPETYSAMEYSLKRVDERIHQEIE